MKQPEWHHLPNSTLIHQLLADLKANPDVFARAWHSTWERPLVAARIVAKKVAPAAAFMDAFWDVQIAARDPGRGTNWNATDAARDAILALVVYDDAYKYLNMSYEKLKVWAELSEEPAAVLLLPYVWAREQIPSNYMLDNKSYW